MATVWALIDSCTNAADWRHGRIGLTADDEVPGRMRGLQKLGLNRLPSAYYGITGNASNLTTFCFHVVHIWQKWLNRRSQKKSMPWVRFLRLLKRYPLPRMTASHSIMLA